MQQYQARQTGLLAPVLPRSNAGTLETIENVLLSLARVVEQRDIHTARHGERLAVTAVALGVGMNLESASLLCLYQAGYLHDIGKLGIPDSILFKPGKLTEEEWIVMCSHPVRGEEICRPLQSLSGVLPVIRHHHERWDGGGYPDGLRGAAIPLLARVLQVADIYDALTNPRTYKPAIAPARALEILQEETVKGWRDPAIVGLFVGMHQKMTAKIAGYSADRDHSLREMRNSLSNLRTILGS